MASAKEKREKAKQEYDVFVANCPTRQVMATIGDKWGGLTINALSHGPLRHSQLMKTIAGASQKMLTQTLRTLERDGLVSRTVVASVPVQVTYELTPLGRTLVPVLRALKNWSETHIEDIIKARKSYESHQPRQVVAT